MTSIVEIESTTLELLFKNLEADVNLLKMATVRKWENGKEHYTNRINKTFDGLKHVESMIDSVTETFNKDIEHYKTGGDTVGMADADDDDNSVVKIRKELLKIKRDMKTKLEKLKGIHWERDIRLSGFQDFELEPDLSDKATRREDDGKLYVRDIEKGTVKVYDD